MKFNSSSVLLNDGVHIKVMVHSPAVFKGLQVNQSTWVKSVTNFNRTLNERDSVTETINGLKVDVLSMETNTDGLHLVLVVNKGDVQVFGNKHFSITGELIFSPGDVNEVDDIVIKDLLWSSNSEGSKHGVLNKT